MTNRIAIKSLLGLLLAVVLFHLCILIKIIPYEITWGGRLKSDQEMYIFETISILVNLFLGFVLLIKGGYIKDFFQHRVINILLWTFWGLFVLNTIGNTIAKTSFERSFALLTFIFAVLIGIILKNKRQI